MLKLQTRPQNTLIPKHAYSMKTLLSKWTAVAMILVALVAVAWSFWQAYDEITDFQDDTLENIAVLVQQQHQSQPVSLTAVEQTDNDKFYGHVPDSQILIEYLPADRYKSASPVNSQLIKTPTGFSSHQIDEQEWRMLRVNNADGSSYIVRQPTDIRYEVAVNNALSALLPVVLLLLVLLLGIQLLIRALFQLVTQLANELDNRADNELSPLTDNQLPNEIKPFVSATNTMMHKVGSTMGKQQRFIADAAHELRSPLTATSLQVQHMLKLANENSEENGKDSTSHKMLDELQKLSERIKRNEALVEQLLALSKAQHMPVQQAPLAVKGVLQQVIGTLLPIADNKHMDFEISGEALSTLSLRLDANVLTSILKNIIQNSLKYASEHTTVSIHNHYYNVENGRSASITITDQGKGIAPENYDKAFEPFTRFTSNQQAGSGLGLSIVKRLCDEMGITVTLSPAHTVTDTQNQGLSVRFDFPESLVC